MFLELKVLVIHYGDHEDKPRCERRGEQKERQEGRGQGNPANCHQKWEARIPKRRGAGQRQRRWGQK